MSTSRGRTARSSDAGSKRSQAPTRSLVEMPSYRDRNLIVNNIDMIHPCDPLPPSVARRLADVHRQRSSPEPSQESIRQDRSLHNLVYYGAGESEVEKHFQERIFPDPRGGDVLLRLDKQVMSRDHVPRGNLLGLGGTLKVSTPVPDTMFGYDKAQASLRQHQRLELIQLDKELVANNQNVQVLCPFLIVEYKGEGGSLWAATNQCLGGSATCVNILEKLNDRLRACHEPRLMDSSAYSIAMNGAEARVHVTWFAEPDAGTTARAGEYSYALDTQCGTFCMAELGNYNLRDPEDHLAFRRCVRNILDWGRTARLTALRGALDTLAEERRLRASVAAKARPKRGGEPSTGRSSKR